nr:MAG TPA: hypothetical protein [Caudoviricetes sp.]
MNEVKVFTYQQKLNVRTVMKDGEPWFVATDVCRALEISNTAMALSRLDDDEKGVSLIDTLGGKQDLTTINEPGLYKLVLGSRKPEAKEFKRWVTHEVLPTIRKTGEYKMAEMFDDAIDNILTPEAIAEMKEEARKDRLRKALEANTKALVEWMELESQFARMTEEDRERYNKTRRGRDDCRRHVSEFKGQVDAIIKMLHPELAAQTEKE